MVEPTVLIFIASLAGTVAAMALPFVIHNWPTWIWKLIFWISFPILVCSIILLAYEYLVMPRIQEIKHTLPIILVGLGILFFGIGTIWYLIQLHRAIAISPPSQSTSTPIPGPQGPAGPPGPKTEIINQAGMDIIKKLARLQLLQRDLPKLEALKEKYEKTGANRFTQYTKLPGQMGSGSSLNITEIMDFARDVNEKIDIFAIDTKKYDINMPFPEEDQIKDKQTQYLYRKARYEYLSGNDKIEYLISLFKKEIWENQRFINEYAKKNIP